MAETVLTVEAQIEEWVLIEGDVAANPSKSLENHTVLVKDNNFHQQDTNIPRKGSCHVKADIDSDKADTAASSVNEACESHESEPESHHSILHGKPEEQLSKASSIEHDSIDALRQMALSDDEGHTLRSYFEHPFVSNCGVSEDVLQTAQTKGTESRAFEAVTILVPKQTEAQPNWPRAREIMDEGQISWTYYMLQFPSQKAQDTKLKSPKTDSQSRSRTNNNASGKNTQDECVLDAHEQRATAPEVAQRSLSDKREEESAKDEMAKAASTEVESEEPLNDAPQRELVASRETSSVTDANPTLKESTRMNHSQQAAADQTVGHNSTRSKPTKRTENQEVLNPSPIHLTPQSDEQRLDEKSTIFFYYANYHPARGDSKPAFSAPVSNECLASTPQYNGYIPVSPASVPLTTEEMQNIDVGEEGSSIAYYYTAISEAKVDNSNHSTAKTSTKEGKNLAVKPEAYSTPLKRENEVSAHIEDNISSEDVGEDPNVLVLDTVKYDKVIEIAPDESQQGAAEASVLEREAPNDAPEAEGSAEKEEHHEGADAAVPASSEHSPSNEIEKIPDSDKPETDADETEKPSVSIQHIEVEAVAEGSQLIGEQAVNSQDISEPADQKPLKEDEADHEQENDKVDIEEQADLAEQRAKETEIADDADVALPSAVKGSLGNDEEEDKKEEEDEQVDNAEMALAAALKGPFGDDAEEDEEPRKELEEEADKTEEVANDTGITLAKAPERANEETTNLVQTAEMDSIVTKEAAVENEEAADDADIALASALKGPFGDDEEEEQEEEEETVNLEDKTTEKEDADVEPVIILEEAADEADVALASALKGPFGDDEEEDEEEHADGIEGGADRDVPSSPAVQAEETQCETMAGSNPAEVPGAEDFSSNETEFPIQTKAEGSEKQNELGTLEEKHLVSELRKHWNQKVTEAGELAVPEICRTVSADEKRGDDKQTNSVEESVGDCNLKEPEQSTATLAQRNVTLESESRGVTDTFSDIVPDTERSTEAEGSQQTQTLGSRDFVFGQFSGLDLSSDVRRYHEAAMEESENGTTKTANTETTREGNGVSYDLSAVKDEPTAAEDVESSTETLLPVECLNGDKLMATLRQYAALLMYLPRYADIEASRLQAVLPTVEKYVTEDPETVLAHILGQEKYASLVTQTTQKKTTERLDHASEPGTRPGLKRRSLGTEEHGLKFPKTTETDDLSHHQPHHQSPPEPQKKQRDRVRSSSSRRGKGRRGGHIFGQNGSQNSKAERLISSREASAAF